MAAAPPDRILLRCPCGAKLAARAASIGRKIKCPKCSRVLIVPPPTQSKTTAAATLKDDGGDYGVSNDPQPDAPAPAKTLRRNACPNCRTPLAPQAVLCVSCGYDTRTQTLKKTVVAKRSAQHDPSPTAKAVSKAAKTAGTFVLGIVLSALGALIGATVWFGVAVLTGFQIGWIAWGLGFLAGLGMVLGSRKENPLAGAVAAGIAVLGIFAAKAMIVFYVLAPLLAVNRTEIDLSRSLVAVSHMKEVFAERKIDPEHATEEQYDAAYKEASKRVAAMPDDQVAAEFEKLADAGQPARRRAAADDPVVPPKVSVASLIFKAWGFFDILFLCFAIFTAYRVAAGTWSTG